MSQTVARAPAAQYRWGVYRGDLLGKPPPLKSAAAVPPPGTHPTEMGACAHRKTCSPTMLTVALSVMAANWESPQGPRVTLAK